MSKNYSETVSQEKPKEELKPIEVLAEELEIKETILAGIMTMKNWRKGKMLTKADLEDALLKFLNKTV
nr:hypothetical protein [uncultured Tyzzerella sp.]